MMRILDHGEFEFLRLQPGMTSRQIARIRIQRCRIFRGYLRLLDADFRRVCGALKLVIAESAEDRSDLATLLLRHQALFARAMIRARLRLLLFACGLGHVEVSGLMTLFDGMRRELYATCDSTSGSGARFCSSYSS